MTGIPSVLTFAVRGAPLLTRPGTGLMPAGAELPVPDRRDNYWIEREVRVVAAAVTAHGLYPVQECSCYRLRIPNGQQLHSLEKTSSRPVFPILWIVQGHQIYLLHLPPGISVEFPCFRLFQYVRYYPDQIGRNRLLTGLMEKKIRFWHSLARIANSCQQYLD